MSTKEEAIPRIEMEEAPVRFFFAMPFELAGGEKKALHIAPKLFREAPVARLVGVSGKHHDVSNSFRVDLWEVSNGLLFSGTLGDLYSDATVGQFDGSDFELVVHNPFPQMLMCPRLRFDIVALVEV